MAVVFPIVWRFVDIYGVAKVDRTFDDIVHNKVVRVTSRLLTFYIRRVSLCDHSVVFPSFTNIVWSFLCHKHMCIVHSAKAIG